MKPKPFASLNHFTIPVAIERSLGRLEPPITIIRTSGRSGECLCAPKVARPTVDGGHFFELFRQRRTSPAELVRRKPVSCSAICRCVAALGCGRCCREGARLDALGDSLGLLFLARSVR